MGEVLNLVISNVNNILWSYVLIGLLLILGVYFTLRSNFVQFVCFPDMIKILTNGKKTDSKGVSSFQAFCISVASHVGTGNMAGVAIAIAVGGPGAVFWMWLIALIGAGSSFVENTLAQAYKVKDEDSFRGGPAYYMEKALNKRYLGVIFSILITIAFGLVFNSVQANTISLAFSKAFNLNKMHVGFVVAIITSFVIFGGIKRIAKVAESIVPIMAIAYVIVASFVIIKNISLVPSILTLIIEDAFDFNSAIGGGIGVTIMQGIKRGLFSNEAGMGSAPNAGATANVSHPVKQGLIQTFGVFIDTIVICSATAFIVLLSGAYENTELNGIELTQSALSSQVGSWGNIFIAICILMFAFSSIIGNYYYGESNIEFMTENKSVLLLYRLAVVVMVLWGSYTSLDIVWSMADLFMGFMAILNLLSILALSKYAFKLLNNYKSQVKEGKDPVFEASMIPQMKGIECWDEKIKLEKTI
ncbi:MAG: alanine:cation symporter family protein [Peptostreptococcaceae bacterium]|jgi:AGCS family alanine or glycine:cation symporter|nr:alanine:cation symporter family protein [Peptostreptococcaceae bacterium]